MKATILFFLISTLSLMNASAQDFDIQLITDKLEAADLITAIEKNQLIESSKKGFFDGKIKASFLYNLGNIYLKKYLPDNVKGMNIPISAMMGPSDLLKKDTTEVGQNKTKLINQQLIELGLIDQTIYEHWVKKSKEISELNNDAAMIMFYSAQTLEIEEKSNKKKEVLVLIEKCKQQHILTDDFEKNHSKYLPNINEAVDLVAHMDHGVTIELATLPKDPKEGHTEIFNIINKSFEELSIKLEDFNLTKIEEEDSKGAEANIQLSTNQKIYSDTFYYSPYGHKWTFDDINVTKLSDKLIDIVNEILFLNNSAYKFYAIKSSANSYNKNKLGFAFLEKDNYQKLRKTFPEFSVSGPHPTKNLNAKMVEIYEKEFIEIGLIKTSNPPRLRDSIQQFNDFFSYYNITQNISFLINEERNHTTVLKEIGDIIGEEFQITPISEVWDSVNSSIHLAFYLNGKQEEMDLTIYERKNDRVFFDRKKELLQAANLRKKFVSLSQQTGPRIGFGYFTEDQIDWIKTNGNWIYPVIYNK